MKTFYLLSLIFLLLSCQKQQSTELINSPEIGTEHNRVLTLILEKLHDIPLQE